MRPTTRLLCALILSITLAPSAARGDAIWVNSGASAGGAAAAPAGNALKLDKVKITDVAGGRVVFNTMGRESFRDVAQVVRIQVDDEPVLSSAEEALAGGKFDVATDGFRRAMDAAGKPWVKQWAAQRLVTSAQRAGRFDAAVAGFITLVMTGDAQRAEQSKPALPAEKSTFIATAIADVNKALADQKIQPAQRQVLQSFLLELQRAGGDPQGAAGTAQQLMQQGGPTASRDRAAAASVAKVRLDGAVAAAQNKQFAKAIEEINAVRGLIVDPKDQVQALYWLAEAQHGLAGQKNDTASWQDAALAFMRVVAHFKAADPAVLPAAPPLVARSLLRTAEIQERLRDPDAARTLYEQVAAQYPLDPSASAAKAALQRLGSPGASPTTAPAAR